MRSLLIILTLIGLLGASSALVAQHARGRTLRALRAAATSRPFPLGFTIGGRYVRNPSVEALLAHKRSLFGNARALVTATTDIPDWIPDVIAAAIYDTMLASDWTLSGLATPYGELEGRPGESFTIPEIGPTTPADDLAETVPAVDDKLTSSGVTVTIKEAVKSIAWYDRAKVQSGQDVNTLAGGRVGTAINDRIEIDLGAALVAGRNTGADATAATLNLGLVKAMKAKIPAKLRRRGLVLLATDDILSQLFDDATVQNAATFGSDEVLREGAFSRPLYGVLPLAVDDGTFPNIGANPPVVMMMRGTLIRAFQRRPQTETERDARARLTRIVGTCFHGEGVVDSRGVVATGITG